MAADVITLIKADHRKVEELFAKLSSGRGDPRAIVAALHALLTAHARAEEDVIYPRLDAHHGLEQHKEAEVLLDSLKRAEPGGTEFAGAHALLAVSVSHHVQEEESTLLPLLARTTSERELRDLGRTFRQRRQQELRALTWKARAASGGGHLTKTELYERAREADIPGRSRMSKKELEKALARARS
ncbi:hemerythrin-like domain-containing protein [Nonomuraea thailandensis]|uniref:Hemerythrin-like domain-containing protein n=1 Tax=Nonomuraea thailandensis TaxID=1188745 RepID=A0A9X2GBI8_9ACTN|nr:hemerythrin domain-containing protein [Nonomuraea thailandensis]MCP2356144.1 hemerythrin-like domain-containing protein [Nonomuraea thailandensis]